ncbi:hypothetical protein H4R24_002060 [Coemansia sp. RSA 988]|nr:hypothetical protein H4R24_002060 [Coemansia sp. RSA 988]
MVYGLICAASATKYREGRVVLGYFPVQRTVSDIPWQSLTHANIAFAFTSESGNITFVGDVVNSTMSSEQNARELIAAGQKNGVKMLVAVGGQGNFSNQLATALSSPDSQSVFLSNAVDFVKDYNLDGIDIDWEYPKDLDDAQILLTTLQGTRNALDNSFGRGEKLLTITLYNHPYLGPDVPTVDYKPYYDAVDYGLMMAYDYFGSWADYTAPNSPFIDVPFYPGSFRNTTDAWLAAGWPANKLVAGLAFYGHSSIVSTDMSANMTNQYVPIDNHTSIDGPISDISGTWTWRDLREPSDGALSGPSTAGSGWTRTWDRFTMTPWLFRKADGIYIGYDDQDSLGIKLDYSLRNDLAGVMIWEIGYDYKNELMSYVSDFIVQLDDGAEPKNCAPSDSDLDNIYDTSRNPNFFNRRSPSMLNIGRDALDTDTPICYFGDVDEQSTAATTWSLTKLNLIGAAAAATAIISIVT